MVLLHERLPCSDNFFRYFRNYDKYMEEKRAAGDGAKSPTNGDDDASYLLPKLLKSPIRSIESPKYNLALSPIHKFVKQHNSPQHSPAGGLQNQAGFNIDTQAQKILLQHAAINVREQMSALTGLTLSDTNANEDSKMEEVAYSPKTTIQNIPLQRFKQSHI